MRKEELGGRSRDRERRGEERRGRRCAGEEAGGGGSTFCFSCDHDSVSSVAAKLRGKQREDLRAGSTPPIFTC
eukprot:681032-Hanusia_phi.AAC.1